ncbi:phosphate acyltransferase PlsX [Porcipelethomonas sp.]|uniref:phosphate acyltransferase PlsX n=1 Tax=Porcipelethomonas sp. TaxID=2981675 RepID=UPI003EF6A9ED
MNIIVDAFGGDNAPLEVIKGCRMARKKLGTNITLTGNKDEIKKTAAENGIDISDMEIVHAESVIDIHEEPTEILKSQNGCSMAVGLKLLKEDKGDAFVSAGSTGALVVGSTFIAKRIKGIKRAVLAPILPTATGHVMLTDGGANVDCRPEMLVQFAIMASAYMEKVMGIKNPKVGLINVGGEETKGRELEIEAYKLLQQAPVNFCGNLEARDLPGGNFDVAVTDGFTGNVVLKLYEGMGSFFAGKLKDIFSGGVLSKLSAMMVMGKIKDFKKQMDYTEEGGAVLMGIAKPVIKAHGSSDAKAFYNAVRQAKACVDGGVTETIIKSIETLPEGIK